MTTLLDRPPCTEILDDTCHALADGDIRRAMGALRTSLHELRSQLPPGEWQAIGEEARRHPLHRLLLESPFTRRAYDKPRGYAGDAVLMDLIYGLTPGDDLSPGACSTATSSIRPAFRASARAVPCSHVRSTRSPPGGRAPTLAVASGHLRKSSGAPPDRAVTFTALDQTATASDASIGTISTIPWRRCERSLATFCAAPLRLKGDRSGVCRRVV